MSQTVRVVAVCDPMPDDKTFLLPEQTTSDALPDKVHVLVVGANGNRKILRWSRRADGGQGACVSPSVLQSLGGEGDMTYRGLGFLERVARDGMLRLQALISLLTLVAAALSAYGTWIKNTTGSSATAWDRETATIVLIIACVLASAKFYKESKEW